MRIRTKMMTTAAMELNADSTGKDWTTYHGTYKSWHHSTLGQINTKNVKNLKVAWLQQIGHSTRGVQSMPLAKDGIVYLSASYSKVLAFKGDTGEIVWSYTPKLDDELVARQ